jgi:hypothetical protein
MANRFPEWQPDELPAPPKLEGRRWVAFAALAGAGGMVARLVRRREPIVPHAAPSRSRLSKINVLRSRER